MAPASPALRILSALLARDAGLHARHEGAPRGGDALAALGAAFGALLHRGARATPVVAQGVLAHFLLALSAQVGNVAQLARTGRMATSTSTSVLESVAVQTSR